MHSGFGMHDCEAAEAELVRLRQENEQLKSRVVRLERRLDDVEPVLKKATAALARAEGGSFAKPENHKHRSKKPGAREGHEAHHRPPSRIDEEKDATLARCPACETRLGEPIEVRNRVVEDIVPARIQVTKYRVHRYWCTTCKAKVEARPSGVLPGQRFGLHLMLLVCFLRTLGLSLDKIRAYLGDAFRVKMSHGAIVNVEAVMGDALGPVRDEFLKEVRKAASVHADETSWRIEDENHWLWVLLSKKVAYYAVHDTRSRRPIEEHLGKHFAGVVVTDFYSSFKNLPYANQKCLVHLLREIRRFEAKPDFRPGREWKRVRMRVKRLVTEAVAGHERLKNGERRAALKARLVARAAEVAVLPRRHKYAKTLARLVGGYKESLFTFLDHEDVHWENNPAERALRPMVVNRKMSYGSASTGGADRRCVLQSVAETARLRGTTFLALAGERLGVPALHDVPDA